MAKIRKEFVQSSRDRLPCIVTKIAIQDTEPGMDARMPCTNYPEAATSDGAVDSPRLLLAELHPDTLRAPTEDWTAAGYASSGGMEDGWPGFFHRAHHYLRHGELLLLATRQRRDAGRLTDPLGSLIACARTAGFRYLQHIVIIHGHATGNQIVPTPPENAPPGLIHSDLLVLSSQGVRP
ncbi:hypothetical protein ACFQVC_21415 [Streptomyces monticola]|uniref:Uncharacterized protein n=1 Tax=Streptomyces monticola TaxID=2666263 RepID=A0ABW2JLY7_9ACTN